jgi:hypothetical protein
VLVQPPGGVLAPLQPSAYTATPAAPAAQFPAFFNVTMGAAQPTGSIVTIRGRRIPERSTDVKRAGVLQSQRIEVELDKVIVVAQELRRDIDDTAATSAAEDVAIREDFDALSDKFASAASAAIAAAATAVDARDASEGARDTSVAASASSQAALRDFKGRYYGALSANPSVDPNGNPNDQGDLYWNSTVGQLRVYGATGWVGYTNERFLRCWRWW